MRRRNFFRVFGESLNYLTTGRANLGPVYAAADRAEQEFYARREEQQQQALLAEMAIDMGMGELVGLMQLGDTGVNAVRSAVIGAVTSGVARRGGAGGGGSASAPADVQPQETITPQERDSIELFEVSTGGDGSVSTSLVTSEAAQPTSTSTTAAASQPAPIDSMVEFADFSAPVGSGPAPIELAAADVAMQDAQPFRAYKQGAPGDAAETPSLGFSGRTLEGMPGQVPGPNMPSDPDRFALSVTDGTTEENSVAYMSRVNDEMDLGLRPRDDTLYRQNVNGIEESIRRADQERREEIQRLEEEAEREEDEAERRSRMERVISNSFFSDPAIRDAALALAASGTEDAESRLSEIIKEEASINPATRGPRDTQITFDTAFQQYNESIGSRQQVLGIANTQLEVLSDPSISLNRLRTQVAVPIVEWVAPIANELGINLDALASEDEVAGARLAYSQTILSVAPQSSQLPGAISNTEFLAFQEPARVADQPRLSGLVLNQSMRRSVERENLVMRLRREYTATTPYNMQTPEGMEQFVTEGVVALPVFRDMDRRDLLAIRNGGMSGMSAAERAEVVRVHYYDLDENGELVRRSELTTIGAFDDINDDFLGTVE